MGTRGPAKKPAAQHKRAGTYRKDRHATPDLPAKSPAMPTGMTKGAGDAWKRIVPALETTGYLAEVDAEALRQLCEAIDDYQKAGAAITKHGLLVSHHTSDGRIVKRLNPAWTMRKDCRAAIISLAQKFGMTPSGRTGLGSKDDDSLPPELAAVLGVNLN